MLKSARGDEIAGAIRAVRSGESVLAPEVTNELLHRVVEPDQGVGEIQAGSRLTARETEVLRLAASGMSNKDIAAKLFLSLRTVKAHLTNIFNKMGVGSRTEAIVKGLREDYITLEDIPSGGKGG